MDYKTPNEAKDLPGLRLALTTGLPAPWSMTARFMFDVKKIPYVPVEQLGGQANEDLIAWTGHRNAPVAMLDDEPARTNWADIIELAERLQPEPRLIPENIEDRISMFGLANEICGAGGLTYNARHTMVGNMLNSGIEASSRRRKRWPMPTAIQKKQRQDPAPVWHRSSPPSAISSRHKRRAAAVTSLVRL